MYTINYALPLALCIHPVQLLLITCTQLNKLPKDATACIDSHTKQ